MENYTNTSEMLIDSATGAYFPLRRRKIFIILGITLIAAPIVLAFLVLAPGIEIFERSRSFRIFLHAPAVILWGVCFLVTASNRFGTSVLRVYDSHLMARGLEAKNEIRIEYRQISSTKLFGKKGLHIQLGRLGQYKTFNFLFSDKNAAYFKNLIDERCEATRIQHKTNL